MQDEFSRVGIFFRIFERVKSFSSVESKRKMKGSDYYNGKTKLMRDIIGIRIVLYFSDDIAIVYSRLSKLFNIVEETIDKATETNFEPIRINLVCQLPLENIDEFKSIVNDNTIDATFEIQLRTILSEGWHEVDHDLRYKCRDDWNNSSDLSRSFNGILATLETSEYATLRLFDQLSFRHFKSKNVIAMLRTKFRLRFESFILSENVSALITPVILKEYYKIDRNEVVKYLFECGIIMPLTLENFLFLINYRFIKNTHLTEATPEVLSSEFKNLVEVVKN
ncbi:hypothetical protein [Ravibacter arvi]